MEQFTACTCTWSTLTSFLYFQVIMVDLAVRSKDITVNNVQASLKYTPKTRVKFIMYHMFRKC